MKKLKFYITAVSLIFNTIFLVLNGSAQVKELWGMTYSGGQYNAGVIFKTDGSGDNQSVQHTFFQYEGSSPQYAKVIQASDGNFYGTTYGGGVYGNGILFQYNPSTSTYTKKFDFNFAVNIGAGPDSLMQASDGNLYGMTGGGGTNSLGVLFQYNPITSTYTIKFDFTVADGNSPLGSLIQATDGNLYGMTNLGGVYGNGVLFQYNPSTSTYTKKFDFDGGTNGSYPRGELMQASDGNLYGMTYSGGTNNMGVLFQYNPTTSTYTKRLDFTVANGSNPLGSLMQATDGNLYGMTSRGGVNDLGVLFQYSSSTSTYTKKLDFDGGTNGSYPHGTLMQALDGNLYGTTYNGGTNNMGVLFQYNLSISTYIKKFDFDGSTSGNNPVGSFMQALDGNLYGMTYQGGASNLGVFFQYDPSTSIYTKKLDFGTAINGSFPFGSLIQASDGNLYGMTCYGGTNNNGVLFQYNPSTSTYTKKLDFLGATNGAHPRGSLMQASDGNLYGMSYNGGASDNGVLFQYNPTTTTYTKKLDFGTGTNGSRPFGSLIQATDGNLYGMTYEGGTNNKGVLFQYNPSTSTYTKKLDFDGATNGRYPYGSLMQASDGNLYGMTYQGGASDNGVLFQYNPTTTTYTKILDFAYTANGSRPYGSLIQATDGNLYGMTYEGGTNSFGVLFQYNPTTTAYIKKFDFAHDLNGSVLSGSLIQASDGNLYGMTSWGGATDDGVLFQYSPSTSNYTKKLDFNVVNGQRPAYTSLIEIDLVTGVTDYDLENQISIYPNPNNGTFTITSYKLQIMNVEIYNVIGECIHRQIGKSSNLQLDLSEVKNGVYFLQLKTAQGAASKKIIINK